MLRESEISIRRLLLTVSTFVSLFSLVAIYALRYLPEDPLHIRASLTAYVIFFLLVSVLGFVGAIKRSAPLITVFAAHLLLDSIIFFIPRILLVRYSFSLPQLICSNGKFPDPLGDHPETSAAIQHKLQDKLKTLSSPAWSEGSCLVWMWSLEVVLLCLMTLHFATQTLLCVRLFGYAKWLGRKGRLERFEREQLE
ncbi:hypothetical protein BT63DRAFT_450136 [Microthyrium microscopicum]|uniref:Uncharacterized protein n=1 Tax=Microthyrium microscopicum TaxID=703497 RepID=A0A6A6UW02_9PEZI|nr:hypothetical protein BT63DRAFT_450136 [Microthyrium microscopicum]